MVVQLTKQCPLVVHTHVVCFVPVYTTCLFVHTHPQFDKLPAADVIVITHSHSDHFQPSTIEKLWKCVIVFQRSCVPPISRRQHNGVCLNLRSSWFMFCPMCRFSGISECARASTYLGYLCPLASRPSTQLVGPADVVAMLKAANATVYAGTHELANGQSISLQGFDIHGMFIFILIFPE